MKSVFLRSAAALVFGVIWGPWISYNHVPEPRLPTDAIEQARRVPDDTLLKELGGYHLYPPLAWSHETQLVTAAERLLAGRVELPGFPATSLELPFSASAMASGPTMWQLFVHSLGIPKVLLDAYNVDGRSQFLVAAAEYLVAYDAYEHSAWMPDGFLWNDTWRRYPRNDHAVASRVPVLTEFWRLYRRSANYRPEVGAAVLRMAGRAAYLVSDPRQFTVATNHGVMQNLAACNLELAFPYLPGVEGHCRLAFRRLDEQLVFFINDEGFVLEHSPGYQSFSVRLIGIALRYMTLSKIEVPMTWVRKYQAAQRVYGNLRRPDGTLPVFGDTDGGPDGVGPPLFAVDDFGRWEPRAPRLWTSKDKSVLAPVAGYALWWDGVDAKPGTIADGQTVLAWSHFLGMGHKHADEMSLSLWARGTSWWANVGYWSYDAAGRDIAESWEGANAPHIVGEPSDSPRDTHLRYYGRNNRLAAIDLERDGPGPNRLRRQVVHVGSRLWLVIDSSSGADGARMRTIWTTSPTVQLTPNGLRGGYTLIDDRSGHQLRAFFEGAPGAARHMLKGSLMPFGGWSVVGWVARPSTAVVVERPTDGSWALAVWYLPDTSGSKAAPIGSPQMKMWAGPEDWHVIVQSETGAVSVQRRQKRIDMTAPSHHSGFVELNAGSDISTARGEIRAALTAASNKYRTADMSGTYRLKVTAVLLFALLLNSIVLAAIRRFRPQFTLHLRILLAAGWFSLSAYFIFVRTHLV